MGLAGHHAAHGLIDRGHGGVNLETFLGESVHQVHLIGCADGGAHHTAEEGILAAHAKQRNIGAGLQRQSTVVLEKHGAFLTDLLADGPVCFHQIIGIGIIRIVASVIDGFAACSAQALVNDAAPLIRYTAHAEHQQRQGQKQGRKTAPYLGCFLTHDVFFLSDIDL